MADVVLYVSSCASTLKIKSDIERLKQLLQAKCVAFEEVDLAMERQRREGMIEVSGIQTVPQLHVKGKHIGGWEEIQDMEDAGEFDDIIKGGDSA